MVGDRPPKLKSKAEDTKRKSTDKAVKVTKTPFTCELVTIHSKRSFADLISRIESTFQHYDVKTLRDLTADGDPEKLSAYVKKVGEPTEYSNTIPKSNRRQQRRLWQSPQKM